MSLRRVALLFVIVGALASLLVAADRRRFEALNRTVEITIDQQDLADFAHAYGYDMNELLREMRRAGLTSVAVYEELGQRVNNSSQAISFSGQQLIDAARTAPLADRTLAAMVRQRTIDPNSVYLIVYDAATLKRYLSVLGTQLEPQNVRVLRAGVPSVVAVKTQIDFFNSLGLGIPADIARQIRLMGLLVDPRVQNNERLTRERIQAVFGQMLAGGRIGTVIFFGQRNEVLGYPYNLDATADNFRMFGVNFGDIEAYDPNQIQKGSQTLSRKIVNQTVRVQAISKVEVDKLDLDTVVARYLLGVRERNIRVIYLRPFPRIVQRPSADGTLVSESAEATNLDMLRRLRAGLQANGFSVGRASGFVDFKGATLEVLYFLAALGAAGAFLLLLDLLGWSRAWMPAAFFAVTALAFWAAFAVGRDYVVRELWALGAAITFSLLAGLTLGPYFRPVPDTYWTDGFAARTAPWAGLLCLLRAVGVALLGGLFVVGLLSQASFMIEVQQSVGTKLLLVAPPLLLLAIYAFTDLFGARLRVRGVAAAPLRVWQFAATLVLATAALVLVSRSGNQPDIGVSGLETHVRGALTSLVGARPRFKEFLIGFPAIVLLPALTRQHRRVAGWLIVFAAAIALSDVLDTFTHIHTPLAVTMLRVFNGLLFGAIIGLMLQYLYAALNGRLNRGAARSK
ncbi:MAG: hypothetical protein GIX00_07675 [Candidatus Eremiobacteraeota bacterium]|nr:hypothetical protein [Candidatus Eremiobacteraeota bacterium]